MTPQDTLDRANASLQRGGRRVVAFTGTGYLVVVFLLLTHRGGFVPRITGHHVSVWLYIAFFTFMSAVIVWRARRQMRMALSKDGIHLPDSSTLRWSDIAAAEARGSWLVLKDRNDNRVGLSLGLAASAHVVFEAMQDHLPPGVRLKVY